MWCSFASAYDMRTICVSHTYVTCVCRNCPTVQGKDNFKIKSKDDLNRHARTCKTCTASKVFDVTEYNKLLTLGAKPAEIDARVLPAPKAAEE